MHTFTTLYCDGDLRVLVVCYGIIDRELLPQEMADERFMIVQSPRGIIFYPINSTSHDVVHFYKDKETGFSYALLAWKK